MARTKIRLPDRVLVLGRIFEISSKKTSDDDYGETDGPGAKILVDASKHTSQEQAESTLMHEIIHAILYVSGQSETLSEQQEEGLVIALENGLSPIYSLTTKK